MSDVAGTITVDDALRHVHDIASATVRIEYVDVLAAEVERLRKENATLRADLAEEARAGQMLQQSALSARGDADRAWDSRSWDGAR